jgi:glycosyltransferase involved in cell wall biosynthesis
MSKPILHQFTVGSSPGDAITDHALLLRRWLREDGFHSEIYAESVAPSLENEIHSHLLYRPSTRGEMVILHHSIGSQVADYLLSLDVDLLVIYHNITPPEYFRDVDPALASQLEQGRRQLSRLRERAVMALGVSHYDELELQEIGFDPTGVLPIPLDESRYNTKPNKDLLAHYQNGGPNLLFVGRLVPNKRHEDLIKLLYHYRRIAPLARLFLIGSPWVPTYANWLQDLADELGLTDAVVFAGHVSQRDLVTHYHLADVFVSMSEHEGLGMPLIESMYFDVPVLAYAASAIPETLGKAGVLFHHKNYEALAEVIDIIVHDTKFRRRLLARQKDRLRAFGESRVRQVWTNALAYVATLQGK